MTIDNIHELLSWQPPITDSIIGDGILLPETRMMIFGQAKAWKTMLSLHTAFCLANGTNWFGYKTMKCLAFKYQVEIPKALDRTRVAKYANGVNSYPPNVMFKTATYVKIDSTYGQRELDKDLQIVQQRVPNQHMVLILDPVYMLMAGHISDEYDVKKFQSNLDELKAKYSMSIILIHHSRLTRVDTSGNVIDLGPEEAMGSSYWNNWLDTMIRVKVLNPHTGGNRVEVSFELTRNAEAQLPSFQVEWSRANLQPKVIKRSIVELDEPTIYTDII